MRGFFGLQVFQDFVLLFDRCLEGEHFVLCCPYHRALDAESELVPLGRIKRLRVLLRVPDAQVQIFFFWILRLSDIKEFFILRNSLFGVLFSCVLIYVFVFCFFQFVNMGQQKEKNKNKNLARS